MSDDPPQTLLRCGRVGRRFSGLRQRPHLTFEFRTEFDFSGDADRTDLLLDFSVDDGAVFHLNGQEIYRYNMPFDPTSKAGFFGEFSWALLRVLILSFIAAGQDKFRYCLGTAVRDGFTQLLQVL